MTKKKITETAEVMQTTEEQPDKISARTIASTIVLALALANQMLAMFGYGTIDIADETVYQVCSGIATIGAAVWAWWKNNSITKAARKADQVLKAEKAAAKEAKAAAKASK